MRAARLLLFLFVSLSATTAARACACPGPGPICSAFFHTPLLFRGTVVSKVLEPEPVSESKNLDGTTVKHAVSGKYRVTFTIAENFRGAGDRREITLYTGESGSSCGYPFETGTEYLVYGSSPLSDGQVWTSSCLGTRTISDLATDTDIQWLRSLPTAPTGARIFGTVTLVDGQPAANTSISITGRQVADTTTDQDGRYNIAGLAPGEYTVHAEALSGFTVDPAQPITMEERGCIQQDFLMEYDSHIRGRVTDEDGHAVAKINIVLESTNASAQDYWGFMHTVWTQEDGSYDVSRVRPGEYTVNVNKYLSTDTPYPSRFYGGDALHGQPVTVGPSASVNGIDVVMPRPWKKITVPVTVSEFNRKPAAGVQIYSMDEANRNGLQEPVQTAADGSATLHLFADHSYSITALLRGGVQRRCSATVHVTAKPGMSAMTLQLAAGIRECDIP